MAYRRRYKKRTSRKRNYRRRFRRSYRYSKKGQKVFLYKRFVDLGTIAADSALNVYSGFDFRLNDLPGWSEFQSLYDSYKINAIKIKFIPSQTVSNSLSTVANNQNTRFISVIDYNDDSNPTSIDDLRQYHTCKVTNAFKTHTRYIYKPKYVIGASQSRMWISTTTPSTAWYGLKVAIEPMGSTVSTSMNYHIEGKYYLSFKSVK